MFRIDKTKNIISKVEEKKFQELGFKEREHLQEWIAKLPTCLGEYLLIIQKEFDGFDGTSERLDLLALDEKGNLVIIENKLDDSGRDVIWQAIKYASYCSSLTKNEIADIYRKYDEKTADYWHRKLSAFCRAVSRDVLIKAVKFRIDNRQKSLSFFDCVGYLYALEKNIPFVTGDKEFEHREGVLFIK